MTEPLRPSSLGEILDRTAHLYRSRFLLFLGIAVVPIGAMVALACLVALAVLGWKASGGGQVSTDAGYVLIGVSVLLGLLVVLPAFLAITALAMAAMNHAVARVYLKDTAPGETVTIRGSYRSVWRRGWRYSGLLLLEGAMVGAAPMMVWFVMVILGVSGTALARKLGMDSTVFGVLIGIAAFVIFAVILVYCVWMALRISLAFPACVVEQISPWPAIQRSFKLSHGTKGRIVVLYLLGTVLNYIIAIVVMLPMLLLAYLIPGNNLLQNQQAMGIVMAMLLYGAMFAAQALVKPVYGITLALFYFDQRIRQEGFDIEWMMQKAGMIAEPSAQPEAAPWLPSKPPKTEAEAVASPPATAPSPGAADATPAEAAPPAFGESA